MLQFETKSSQSSKVQKEKNHSGRRDRLVKSALTDGRSWDIQFSPKKVSDLAVYGPKVVALRNWTLGALYDDTPDGLPHVLALCGNSGCGKSAAVELLCEELEIELIQWNEDCWDLDGRSEASYQHFRPNNSRYNLTDRLVDSLFNLDVDRNGALSTKGETLRSFASMSKYPTLTLTSQPRSGASSDRQPIQHLGNPSRSVAKKGMEKKVPLQLQLQQLKKKKKLVLIQDPPFQYMKQSSGGSSSNMDAVKEAAMFEYIASFDCPVVMIVSGLSGQDDVSFAVEKCIPHSLRSRIKFESLFFPPISDKKIEGVLNSILDKSGARITEDVSLMVPSIAVDSCGDLRHAILQLQFKMTQSSSPSSSFHEKEAAGQVDVDHSSPPSTDRDSSLSSLHSIGKLLHAKLDRGGQLSFSSDWVVEQMELPLDIALCFLQGNCIVNASHSAPCLAYQTMNPSVSSMKRRRKEGSTDLQCLLGDSSSIFRHWQGISQASGLDISAMVDVLAVEQICAALTYFSDCDVLLSKKYDSSFLMDRSNSSSSSSSSSGSSSGTAASLFPEGYVSTLCGKASAVSKGSGFKELYERGQLGGFKGSFAAIHRPKSLDIRMNYLSEKRKMEVRQQQLLRRAIWEASSSGTSTSSGGGSSSSSGGGGNLSTDTEGVCIPTLVSIFDVATLLSPYGNILAQGGSSSSSSNSEYVYSSSGSNGNSSILWDGHSFSPPLQLQSQPQNNSMSDGTRPTDDIEDFDE